MCLRCKTLLFLGLVYTQASFTTNGTHEIFSRGEGDQLFLLLADKNNSKFRATNPQQFSHPCLNMFCPGVRGQPGDGAAHPGHGVWPHPRAPHLPVRPHLRLSPLCSPGLLNWSQAWEIFCLITSPLNIN